MGNLLRISVVRQTEERNTEDQDDFEGNCNDEILDLNNSIENATSPTHPIVDDLPNPTTGGLDDYYGGMISHSRGTSRRGNGPP